MEERLREPPLPDSVPPRLRGESPQMDSFYTRTDILSSIMR